MIQRLSHASIYVCDQEAARRFYVDKVGFEVRADMTMGGFRWLTVAPKGQQHPEMVLMPIAAGPMMDEETAGLVRRLVGKGVFGVGVLETDDCQATYDELTAKGVQFSGPPAQRPYGLEALMKDDSGNWFSIVQRPR